jgi:hypothetical protein
MTRQRNTQRSLPALAASLGLTVGFAALCGAQQQQNQATPNPPEPKVYYNPRSGPDDPRIGLKAGLYDAGEAIFGMEKVASLAKPTGFGPGTNAVATPPPPPPAPGADAAGRGGGRAPAPDYGSTNSDLAFAGNHVFVGNYNGINFYDVDNPMKTKLTASLICPGGQGDVSVYGHLLFMSSEAQNGRIDCGVQGVQPPPGYVAPAPPPPPPPAADGAPAPARGGGGGRGAGFPSPERFKGVRIFDITNMSSPKQVAAVQSCRGSHTHTLVIDPKDKENIYVYISGTGGVRPTEELAGCTGGAPDANPDTALFRIDIIKVPLAHPEQAKIVNSPRIFADEQTGAMNGLWKGGNHGEGTQSTSATNQCHDITVYSELGLAAGACSGNGILLDIHDVVHPKRLDAVSDPNYAFWHSANFANDGSKVLFTDEWGGGGQPRCRTADPQFWGADAIFTLDKGKLTLGSYFKMPAAQTDSENCVAHNGSLIPIPGRDILVQAWYQGGVSMFDFTDATHPYEIAYFDRGPLDTSRRGTGGFWSVYWYNGYIYGSEIVRGLDVFKMVPSKFVTQNEIDAANQVHFDTLNVQNQPKIVWPQNFIVARAYIDQLSRSNALAADRISNLSSAIAKVETNRNNKKDVSALASLGAGLEKEAASAKTPADANRMKALAEIIKKNTSSKN